MFQVYYPIYIGKVYYSINRVFKVILKNIEKQYTLQEKFNLGILVLILLGTNNQFKKLLLVYILAYFSLIYTINPIIVSIGEIISARVFLSQKGVEPLKQLLRIEHLEVVNKTNLRANPLKLLEEVNIGCIIVGLIGRVVTVLVGVNENNTTALNTVFSSIVSPPQGENDEYQLPPGFFDSVDFLGA